MPPPDRPVPPLRFFVLTCRAPETDFRRPLAEALRMHGQTWYIWLRRRPRIQEPDPAVPPYEIPFVSLFGLLRRRATHDRVNVFFNSTNTAFPLPIVLLKLICRRAIWCFDLHDDLLYDWRGWHRAKAAFGIMIQRLTADLQVHAAVTLAELFPRSRHLGNASQIRPISRPPPSTEDGRRVMVLASFDKRFDFDLMDEVARRCPQLRFDVYGQISKNQPSIPRQLAELAGRNANVVHHGSYDLADLPGILAAYHLTFAPYRTGVRLTRYLDPLRFYHCLNSGLELVTTAIPQAVAMSDVLHVVRNAKEAAATLNGFALPRTTPHPAAAYRVQTWEMKAGRLVELLSAIPKFRLLARASPATSGVVDWPT